jgi:S-adenosylmethionine/arginine decarboxylase-like enzyme
MSCEIIYDFLASPSVWAGDWEKALSKVLKLSGVNIVKYFSFAYPDRGKTSIFLISQSHVIIHAWPERRLFNVNVFLCSPAGIDLGRLERGFLEVFSPERVWRRVVERQPKKQSVATRGRVS